MAPSARTRRMTAGEKRARVREVELRRLLDAKDRMDERSHEPLDVAALARGAGLSRAYFIRAFRAAFGETPHQYLMTRRLERAMTLLRTSPRPVTEVCFEVGFGSLGSFSALFKRALGVSPSEYRRLHPPDDPRVPTCVVRTWTRPASTFREADGAAGAHARRSHQEDG